MSEERPRTDGGTVGAERDVRRAGDNPPGVPDQETLDDLLPRLLADVDEVGTAYHVRSRLAGEDPTRAAEQLVNALERKVTVVGSTLDAGVDPDDPQVDVLIECEHTMSQVATALARVAPVDGAIVLDVGADAGRVLEDQREEEQADSADANDVFNELQQQVSEADYDQVVEELEDVSFPGGPDADSEVDLADEAGVELDDDVDAGTTPDEERALDPDRETIDLDDADDGMDPEEASAAELFGEDDEAAGPAQPPEEGADDDAAAAADGEASPDDVSSALESVDLPDPSGDDDETDEDEVGADAAEAVEDEPTVEATDEEPTVEATDEEPTVEATDEEPTVEATDVEPADVAGGEATSASDDGETPPAEAASTGPAEAGAADGPGEDGTPTPETAGPAPAEREAVTDGAAAPPRDVAVEDVPQLVDRLVAAIESGEVDSDRRQRLRDALGIESTHSLDVRLEYLQKRVDNLAAYSDAWEAFIAEEGTGEEFMDEVRAELDELAERVDAMEDGATAGEGGADVGGETTDPERVAELEERLAELETRHDEDVASLRERLDSMETEVREQFESVRETVASTRDSLRQLADWRESVNEVLRGRDG